MPKAGLAHQPQQTQHSLSFVIAARTFYPANHPAAFVHHRAALTTNPSAHAATLSKHLPMAREILAACRAELARATARLIVGSDPDSDSPKSTPRSLSAQNTAASAPQKFCHADSEQAFVLPAATVVHGVLQCCVALPVNAAKNIPKTKMPASFDTGIVSFCSGLRQNPRPHGVGVA
jgi:hypothetical protein